MKKPFFLIYLFSLLILVSCVAPNNTTVSSVTVTENQKTSDVVTTDYETDVVTTDYETLDPGSFVFGKTTYDFTGEIYKDDLIRLTVDSIEFKSKKNEESFYRLNITAERFRAKDSDLALSINFETIVLNGFGMKYSSADYVFNNDSLQIKLKINESDFKDHLFTGLDYIELGAKVWYKTYKNDNKSYYPKVAFKTSDLSDDEISAFYDYPSRTTEVLIENDKIRISLIDKNQYNGYNYDPDEINSFLLVENKTAEIKKVRNILICVNGWCIEKLMDTQLISPAAANVMHLNITEDDLSLVRFKGHISENNYKIDLAFDTESYIYGPPVTPECTISIINDPSSGFITPDFSSENIQLTVDNESVEMYCIVEEGIVEGSVTGEKGLKITAALKPGNVNPSRGPRFIVYLKNINGTEKTGLGLSTTDYYSHKFIVLSHVYSYSQLGVECFEDIKNMQIILYFRESGDEENYNIATGDITYVNN